MNDSVVANYLNPSRGKEFRSPHYRACFLVAGKALTATPLPFDLTPYLTPPTGEAVRSLHTNV